MAAGNRVPRNVGEGQRVTGTPPCRKLKALRERAGVTALVAAKACGLSSPNSFYRYESVDRMGDTPIPDHIIEAIIPVLIGRGHPPVTADELLAISSAHRLLTVKGRTSGTAPNRILPQPAMAAPQIEQQLSLPLTVRYRAERGVFMDQKAVHDRTFGLAPIVAASDIRAEQFTVLDADSGAMLHCVTPSAYSQQQMLGKRVIVTKSPHGMGLMEIGLARATSIKGNGLVLEDANGRPVDGEVCGVVVGSYARE